MECKWEIFDDTLRVIMGMGLYLTGIFAVSLNGWLLLTILKGSGLRGRSYYMLLNLCAVSLARNLLAGFPFAGTSALARRWVFGDTYCEVFAFLNHFIGVFHMEALTHMCIERYFVAKYVKLGWEMKTSNYAICVALCWLFAVAYCAPPLVGLARYSCDAAGTACSLELLWADQPWQNCFTLAFIVLGGVKPVLVMTWMLWQARQIESRLYSVEKHYEQLLLTESVMLASAATLASWAPRGALVVWPLLAGAAPPPLLVLFASLSTEVATAVPVLVYLWHNPAIRAAMLSGRARAGPDHETNKHK